MAVSDLADITRRIEQLEELTARMIGAISACERAAQRFMSLTELLNEAHPNGQTMQFVSEPGEPITREAVLAILERCP